MDADESNENRKFMLMRVDLRLKSSYFSTPIMCIHFSTSAGVRAPIQ